MNKTGIQFKNTSFYKSLSSRTSLTRLLLILIAIFIILSILNPKFTLSTRNLSSVSIQFPEFGFMCLGMMLSMVIGGIDLSIVSIANLSGILSMMYLTSHIVDEQSPGSVRSTIAIAIIIAIAIGLCCGLLNGVLVSKIGIPPILTTLGTMQVFTGIAVGITKGASISGYPSEFTGFANRAILGIPKQIILFFVAVLIVWMIIDRSILGKQMKLLGANERASIYAGQVNDSIRIKTFAIIGVLSAISGLLLASHTNSVKAGYGSTYTMQTILVCVMGGVDPNGGHTNLGGVIIAVITLQILATGLNVMHVSTHVQTFVCGCLLIGIMIINQLTEKGNTSN